jgi:carbon monoxide dehydrogenase subunit G
MSDIITIILALIGLAALSIYILAVRRPDTFAIERATNVNAPPAKILPLIASPRAMNTWMPFLEPDPNATLDYSGPESGVGAASMWTGHWQVGAGRTEVTDVQASSKVTMKLEMVKPMKASNTVVFSIQPNGSGTNVTWNMSGKQTLMAKVMTLFIDCDKMVGSQFEKGLGKSKAIAER